jgi:hypothetical protein
LADPDGRSAGGLERPIALGGPLASISQRARAGDGLSYFQTLHERFLTAGDESGILERALAIGPVRVRLRFAGEELAQRMLPAFAHLAVDDPAVPDLTLSVWDSRSTGVEVPPFPWRPRDLRQRGEVAGYNDARVRTVYHGDVLDPTLGFHALSMYDATGRNGIFWVESPERVPWPEAAEPLRPLLHWGLLDASRHLVHAGAVANRDGGVLLGGSGGSGKSTSAVACIEAGFKFVSDNYVLLTGGDRVVAHSVFCTAKVRPEGARFHPWVRELVQEVDHGTGEKYVLDLHRHMPERLALSTSIDAVLLPRLGDGGRVLARPISPTQALLALAPSTIYQLPSSRETSLGPMAELVRRVPAYVLELGGPPDQVPAVIAELLARPRPAGVS